MKKITVGVILVGLAIVSLSSMVFHNRTANKTYEASNSIDSLLVGDNNTPITVKGTNGGVITVRYKETRNNKYKIEEDGRELVVERKRNWFPLNWFSFGGDSGEVVVEVPKDQLEEVTLETGNAPIIVENLSLDNAFIDTSNGEVNVSDLEVANVLSARTTNATLTASDLTFEDGEFLTTNGTIEVQQLEGDTIMLESTNANLNFDKVKVTSLLSVESSNGHIKGKVIGKQSEFEIYSDTSNGKNIPGNTDASASRDKMIEADTSNGDIVIEFSE